MSPQKLLHVRLSTQILLLDPPEVSHHDADEDVVFVRRVTTRRLACVTTCPPPKKKRHFPNSWHWEHENILNASRCHITLESLVYAMDKTLLKFLQISQTPGHGQLITILIKIQAEPHHEKDRTGFPMESVLEVYRSIWYTVGACLIFSIFCSCLKNPIWVPLIWSHPDSVLVYRNAGKKLSNARCLL